MKEAEDHFEQILELAQRLENRKSDLQAAAAADAGFPVSVTGMEVDSAVGYLRTMEEEIPWIESGRPYGVVAAIFPYDGSAIMLARLGGAARPLTSYFSQARAECLPLLFFRTQRSKKQAALLHAAPSSMEASTAPPSRRPSFIGPYTMQYVTECWS